MDDSQLMARAQEKLAKAEAEVARWRTVIGALAELKAVTPKVFLSFASSDSESIKEAVGKLSMTESVARSIIEDAGRPVPSAEMLLMLEERKVVIGGKQKSSTLAARLSRAKTLTFERGLGWTIKEQRKQNASEANASEASSPAQIGT